MIDRRAVLFGLPLAVAGCSGQAVWAPDDQVARARFRHAGPPLITLYTCLNNDTRNGAHTGLLISASERVIFDPAGGFQYPGMAERNDVVFGATDAVEDAYTRFQGSDAYHAIKLTRLVSAEVAEMALQAAMTAGPVAKAQCTRAASGLLKALPGFESIRGTWLPDNLMRQFARLPGVTAEFIYLDDDAYRAGALAAYQEDVLSQIAPAADQPVSQSIP